MHAAWTHQVLVQLAHRKGFDIAAFDQAIFDKSFRQFDERDRGSLLALAVGKNVTRNALCHYSRNVKDDKCALCGEVDSKQHRVFHCGALQELRKEYHVLFRTLGQMPEAFWNFGIAETSWEGWQVKCQLPDQWPHSQCLLKQALVLSFLMGRPSYKTHRNSPSPQGRLLQLTGIVVQYWRPLWSQGLITVPTEERRGLFC